MGWAFKLFVRNGGSSLASTLERMVSMTGYPNADKFDIPMVMAMEMMMMSSERMPPLTLPSQYHAAKSKQHSYNDWGFHQDYCV
jgi:hypothetical protein